MGSQNMAGWNSVSFLPFIVLVSCLLGLSTSARIEWKINLGGEPTGGFQAEEAVLSVDENLAKMRFHGSIKGTGTDLNVFKTQRFSRGEDLVLNFPVPDGVYTVTLMFAETWKGAYGAGNRVFDVYLGSKPGGIVKVIDQMDPFRSGGPAGPVRRKFSGIATQGGLTLALRPIKQNPQIAGIVISGYSYGNAFMEDLPTVPAGPFEGGDFGALSHIGPRTPTDPSLLYDPSLNPKLKASNKLPTSGNPASQALITSQNGSPTSIAGAPAQAVLPNPFGTSPSAIGLQSTQVVQNAQGMHRTGATNPASPVTPGLSSPFSNTAYGGVGAAGTGAPSGFQQSQTVGRPAPVAVGTAPIAAPQGPMQYRSFRRRLASFYGEGSPVSFPSAPQGDIPPNEAPLQTAAGPIYSRQVEQTGPMPNQRDQPVEVNDVSQTQMSSPQDITSHNPGNFEGGQGSLEEPAPPNTGETMPLNPLESEGSPTQALSGLSGEQEQAPAVQEPLSQNQMPSPSDLQTHVDNRDVREDVARPFTRGESLQPDLISRSTERGVGDFPERALSEPGSGQIPRSSSLDAPNMASSAQVQDRREFEYGMSDLQSSSHVRGQGGIGNEDYSSEEKGSLEQNRSPGSFMNGIRNQIQSLIQGSKNSEPSPEGSGENLDVPGEVARASRDYYPQETKRTFRPAERMPHGFAVSRSLDEAPSANRNARERNAEMPLNSFRGKPSQFVSVRERRFPQRRRADAIQPRRHQEKFSETDLLPDYHAKLRSGGIVGERSYGQFRTSRSLNRLTARQIEEEIPEAPPSAGVHIGSGRLDGICIDNSTHCSCGMSNADPAECLYVAKEDVEPMLCVRKPCNGKLICACAPGASSLCERSVVRDILVPATVHKHGDTEESEIIPCRREILEQGINVLTALA
eukprot:TRINITY_DN12439_c0_g1_i1.p1 TRINITY_DN12439_c0_g1~~TRINITY_DN12439_c0_g1_i1.p1  ORF type:complete len:911 (+),score=106.73 TRINITY_DN12439_c0_g1_i1:590-3322(+)